MVATQDDAPFIELDDGRSTTPVVVGLPSVESTSNKGAALAHEVVRVADPLAAVVLERTRVGSITYFVRERELLVG